MLSGIWETFMIKSDFRGILNTTQHEADHGDLLDKFVIEGKSESQRLDVHF